MSENANRPLETEIQSPVFTCGVRWGNGAPAFTEISLQTKSAILGVANTNSGIFPTIKEGNILALKNGFGIIALGKVSKTTSTIKDEIDKSSSNLTWGSFLKKNFIPTEDIKLNYWITEDQKIYVVEVEEWIMLDPPIFYQTRQSTVQIRNSEIQQQCWQRIDPYYESQQEIEQKTEEDLKQEQIEYHLKNAKTLIDLMAINSTDKKNEELFNTMNESLQILESLDPENKEYRILKPKHTLLQTDIQTDKGVIYIAKTFATKIKELKRSCRWHTFFFLSLITLLITGLVIIIISPIHTEYQDMSLPLLFFTKFTVSTTVMMAIFWVARFFNRRIHESIHLKEEYEYRELLMNSLESIKNILSEEDRPYHLNQVLRKIIENPNYALSRSKSDKIPTELLALLQNTPTNNNPTNKSDDN